MSFLSDINKNTFVNYLNCIDSNTECEIRFGHFDQDSFISSIPIESFYRLKKLLDVQVEKKLIKSKNFITRDYIYNNDATKKGKIRKTLSFNSDEECIDEKYIVKNTHRKHNIYDYNARISISTEKTLTKIFNVDFHSPVCIRFKNRYSYYFDSGIIDLTIVDSDSSSPNFEIEFEITSKNIKLVEQTFFFILTVLEDNFFVTKVLQKRNIINQYKQLLSLKSPYFIGCQPETLEKKTLPLLYKELYSVTDKLDGERSFLVIDKMGQCFFISPNMEVTITNVLSKQYKNCILDGELIRKKNNNGQLEQIQFKTFDILVYNQFDIRDNRQYLLSTRLNLVYEIVKDVSIVVNNFYKFEIKKFIFRNVFMGADIIMSSGNKLLEGLIFTPMNEPYPKVKKWSKLLKWKPPYLNTIDFFSVKVSDNTWELYIQSIKQKNETEKVLFDIHSLPTETHIQPFDKNVYTHITTISSDLTDPITGLQYKTNTVIEYYWNSDDNKFIPLRTRWDKTKDITKHGNFKTVAINIWNSIHNPITLNTFLEMNNGTTDAMDDIFFFKKFETLCKHIASSYKSPFLELDTFNQLKTKGNTISFCDTIKVSNELYKNYKLDLTSPNCINFLKNILDNHPPINTICLLKPYFDLDNLSKICNLFLQTNNQLLLFCLEETDSALTYDLCNNSLIYYNRSFENGKMKLYISGIQNEIIFFNYNIKKITECFENIGIKLVNKIPFLYSLQLLVFEKKEIVLPSEITNIHTVCNETSDVILYKLTDNHSLFDIVNMTNVTINKYDIPIEKLTIDYVQKYLNPITTDTNLSFTKDKFFYMYTLNSENEDYYHLASYRNNFLINSIEKIFIDSYICNKKPIEYLSNFLVKDLKLLLKEFNLKISGKKTELINRLLDYNDRT